MNAFRSHFEMVSATSQRNPAPIPLLYKSPAFTKKWKMVLTTLVIIYTVYLIIATVEILEGIYRGRLI
jgi:hypothetical protein